MFSEPQRLQPTKIFDFIIQIISFDRSRFVSFEKKSRDSALN